MKIDSILTAENVADLIKDDELESLGLELLDQINVDLISRQGWEEQNEGWMKLATQIMDEKNWPWPNSAKVKYPLITLASIQFAARAYPSLINSRDAVKGRVIGHASPEKMEKARRVGQYMTYQISEEMDEWVDEMDKLLHYIPIVGVAFKKTYFDSSKQRNTSELVLAKDLIVNYYTKSFENAIRKTHRIYLYPNDVQSKIRQGIFRDIELPSPKKEPGKFTSDQAHNLTEPEYDEDQPYKFYECHCWYDFDDDGYKEPYVITLDESGVIVRIVPRFEVDNVFYNAKGKIYKIEPIEYFTQFPFIPDPESGTYAFGFGRLLGPINETVNTTINQLLDAGSLSNLQAGFLSKGIRMKGGQAPFRPGEWRVIQTTGDDLRKSIYPLPVKEPSTVLFQLLGTMIQAGQQVSSVTDLMMGDTPGQNTPASTTNQMLQQGLTMFSSIHKRLHRALKKEFNKLFLLNNKFLDPVKYFTVLDEGGNDQQAQTFQADFDPESIDVKPSSDPDIISEAEKIQKAQFLLGLTQLGTVNPQEATKRILQAQNQEGIEALMQPPPPPPPDPEIELKKAELQHKVQMDQINVQLDSAKLESELMKNQANSILALTKAESLDQKKTFDMIQAQLNQMELKEKVVSDRLKLIADMQMKLAEIQSKEKIEQIRDTRQVKHSVSKG